MVFTPNLVDSEPYYEAALTAGQDFTLGDWTRAYKQMYGSKAFSNKRFFSNVKLLERLGIVSCREVVENISGVESRTCLYTVKVRKTTDD